ncbi:SDR family oxidoreductase [Chitinophaga sp. MM2321]|uniref:SDR family oxidoreductase n=1 Tax=Chitinophaga sp. MM2321 TaxID=3137178 RepID=UPI0032D58D0E
MKRILLAGATGYLGNFILQELVKQGYATTVLVRNKAALKVIDPAAITVKEAAITAPASIRGCCNNIDVVISSVGITRQKDHLTYMDVDYQANLNLLQEAQQSGVKKFIYVAVLHGPELRDLKICAAKERFVEALKKSGLDYCIIRPTGFFSDMTAYLDMAKKGTVYLFGKGTAKMNPIHGADLANVCVAAIQEPALEIEAGGREILTQHEIAHIAFTVLHKKVKIAYIPHWIRRLILSLLRLFTSSKTYGPVEFALTVISMDMIAPPFGQHTLKEYFSQQQP